MHPSLAQAAYGMPNTNKINHDTCKCRILIYKLRTSFSAIAELLVEPLSLNHIDLLVLSFGDNMTMQCPVSFFLYVCDYDHDCSIK